MELVVDLSTGGVALRDGDDMGRFSVQAVPAGDGDGEENGALGALAAALSVHDAGPVDPDGDVLVPAEAVRRLAADAAARTSGDAGPGVGRRLRRHARATPTPGGWIADDGAIRAHIEWRAKS